MKKMLFLISILAATTVNAQSDRYTAAMKKLITVLDSAKTTDDYQNASNNFERIANAEKTQWLPYYYAAYSLVLKNFLIKDTKLIDPLMDKADELLGTAEALSSNNSEITTLQAMATSNRMAVDFSRGQTLGPKMAQMIGKAQQQLPANNPRAFMFQANSAYYTPPAFGGGKDKAFKLMEKALEYFEAFKPETELHPNWGKEYAQKTMEEWKK